MINCGEFLLWNLPNVPECPSGYCTTSSSLHTAGNPVCVDDPQSTLAASGFTCDQLFADGQLGFDACNLEMRYIVGAEDEVVFPIGGNVRDYCPVSCHTCQ